MGDDDARRIAALEAQLGQALERIANLERLVLATRTGHQQGSAPGMGETPEKAGHKTIETDQKRLQASAVQNPAPTTQQAQQKNRPHLFDSKVPQEEKIALFMRRFRGRTDVVAHKWVNAKTGKKGWSPLLRNPWDPRRWEHPEYIPFTPEIVARHLSRTAPGDRPFCAGVYPMTQQDCCYFLACDFDDAQWRHNAAAYATVLRGRGLDPLCEISSSGQGAHVWIFFETAVPAWLARAVASSALSEAMAGNPQMNFDSYDRLFPSQDTLSTRSKGSATLGNLIALPLEGDSRSKNCAVFAAPDSWQPFTDQFAALQTVKEASEQDLKTALSQYKTEMLLEPIKTSENENEAMVPRPRKKDLAGLGSGQVIVTLKQRVEIPISGMPAPVINGLKHIAVTANPEFYRKQNLRLSTWGIPRYVADYKIDDKILSLPRGVLDESKEMLEAAGYTVKTRLPRRSRNRVGLRFRGQLTEKQDKIVKLQNKFEQGILVAPPGAGKTVMALDLIARRDQPTAILVNRQTLARQWVERIEQFLGITPGVWMGAKQKLTGVVDAISIASLNKKLGSAVVPDLGLLKPYNFIIVDECHNAGAPATQKTLAMCQAKYWLGLTATPYRADGLDALIRWQLGPIRQWITVDPPDRRYYRTCKSEFSTETSPNNFAEIYNELAIDNQRNQLIVSCAVEQLQECEEVKMLLLTRRTQHMRILAQMLKNRLDLENLGTQPIVMLHGTTSAGERKEIEKALGQAVQEKSFILVATDSVAGQGLDIPQLNTVMLTMPISFKGSVIQNVGRLTRGYEGDTLMVIDFHDHRVPVLDRIYARRKKVIEKEGFKETPA